MVKRIDVISSLPQRLETIYSNVENNPFSTLDFAGWREIKPKTAYKILYRMKGQGWLSLSKPLTREAGINIYLLSFKALKYREENSSFTNPMGRLYLRWLPTVEVQEVEVPGPVQLVERKPRETHVTIQQGKKIFIVAVDENGLPFAKIGPFASMREADAWDSTREERPRQQRKVIVKTEEEWEYA